MGPRTYFTQRKYWLAAAAVTILSAAAQAAFWADNAERSIFSSVVYAYQLPDYGDTGYRSGVKWMLGTFEARTGKKLAPAQKHHVGLKIYTSSGDGIQTPLPLVRAVIAELKERGYRDGDIFIVDASESKLRESGYLPPLSTRKDNIFDGAEVRYLDSDRWWSKTWFYDNPLPVDYTSQPAPDLMGKTDAVADERERKSFIPAALIEDVDFWINLPVVLDDAAMEVSGSLANATLWNVSNRQRFFNSPANAPVAMAEIAAIPELLDGWALTIVSMEHFQIIGGPIFNSNYVRSDPLLLGSSDPAVLDAWAARRINAYRKIMGFKPVNVPPYAVSFARLVNIGGSDSDKIMWITPPGTTLCVVAADPDKVANTELNTPRKDTGLFIPIMPLSERREHQAKSIDKDK
jgi:hypothetical protein